MAQAYATIDDIRTLAPDLAAASDGLIAAWLAVAESMIGLSRWKVYASTGHALLTAHLVLTAPGADGSGAGEVGPVTSESDGRASRSFAVPTLTDAELSSTGYGRAFVLLRRIVRGQGTGVVLRGRGC